MIDGLRLALGTLTIVPTAPPRVVDRRTGSWAMTLAPLVGALLALAATALIWLLGWSPFGGTSWLPWTEEILVVRPASPMLVAALVISLLAVLTRGLHLDGLADTADGLGSGKPPADALAIMRKSDIGPFGVVTLVLVLLVQVLALAESVSNGRAHFALILGLVLSRLVLPLVCSAGIPAARADGLGQVVAGTVSRLQLAVAVVLAGAAVLTFVVTFLDPDLAQIVVVTGVVAAVSLAAGAVVCWRCVRRFGGITGDVMGACVEVTFTMALVVLTVV